MRRKADFEALLLLIVAIIAGPILATRLDCYEHGMTSLGFSNLTIGNTFYENVEYVFNLTEGDPSEGCQNGLVLAVLPSLELRELPKGFKLLEDFFVSQIQHLGCFVAARHSANPNAKLLTRAQIFGGLYRQEFKKLDFHWYLEGQRYGEVNVSYMKLDGMSEMAKVRQLAYSVWYEMEGLNAVPVPSDWGSACCMRLPSKLSVATSLPKTSYPLFPLIHIGRHDVTIKGREYKNISYYFYPGYSYNNNIHPYYQKKITCPAGLKHAIVPSKKFAAGLCHCSVSGGFLGSPTLAPGEDPENMTVKRSRFQWVLDYEEAGEIPDELWYTDHPYDDWDDLQELCIVYGKSGLRTVKFCANFYPCCMDLSPYDHNDHDYSSFDHSPYEHSSIDNSSGDHSPHDHSSFEYSSSTTAPSTTFPIKGI